MDLGKRSVKMNSPLLKAKRTPVLESLLGNEKVDVLRRKLAFRSRIFVNFGLLSLLKRDANSSNETLAEL